MNRVQILFLILLLSALPNDQATGMDRRRPAYPWGAYDPRAAAEAPRAAEARGLPETRSVADARRATAALNTNDPRWPATYLHTLPANYALRTFQGLNYYYWGGNYYYPYYNAGAPLYVQATVVDGTPTIPLRPYVYSLPAGYTVQSIGGVNYYEYYGYYYYVYYLNGCVVYVLAPVVNGVPTIPQPPY